MTLKPIKATAEHTADPNPTSEATLTLTASEITGLIEALEHCDVFLRTSSRAVRGELADYCLAQPHLNSGALIDTVSLTAYLLRHRLDEATRLHQQRQAHRRRTGQDRR